MATCTNPIRIADNQVSCGQCGPCRADVVRLKTAQLILEKKGHLESVFVTATYSQEHLPLKNSRTGLWLPTGSARNVLPASKMQDAVPSVSIQHLRQIIKGLSRAGLKRYYAVSEYGTESGRPHYHLIIFGVTWGTASMLMRQTIWKYGYVKVDPLTTPNQLKYVAGYVQKKQKDKVYLEHQEPETSMFPRRPPLGTPGLNSIRDWYLTAQGSATLAKAGDVPDDFRYNNHFWPLSDRQKRYLRRELGLPETLQEVLDLNPHAQRAPAPDLTHAERANRWQSITKRKNIHAQKTQRI